ncbi:MAG TPA: hypothetical protein VFF57_12125 [Hanamia sp.]|nr:hypothetical protein [Hanamia sp.]
MNTETSKLTIEEIQQHKKNCETAILNAINVFREKTGLNPMVAITTEATMCGYYMSGVEVTVQV